MKRHLHFKISVWDGDNPFVNYYQKWYIDAAAGTWKTGK